MQGWGRALLTAAWILSPGCLVAQQQPRALAVPQAQILTIDASRLFPGTIVGQSILEALAKEREAFAIESQSIAAALREEELALTEQRDTLPREEFAALAEDFDARVQAAREERDARETALAARADGQELAFLRQVRPILGQIMDEAGAVVIIEADTVFLRNGAIDVTALAIARINEATRTATPREEDAQPPADGAAAD